MGLKITIKTIKISNNVGISFIILKNFEDLSVGVPFFNWNQYISQDNHYKLIIRLLKINFN